MLPPVSFRVHSLYLVEGYVIAKLSPSGGSFMCPTDLTKKADYLEEEIKVFVRTLRSTLEEEQHALGFVSV